MQEAQYDFLHGQTDRSDFFSPAIQQLCGIMKDNQVALPSDIGEGYFRYISPCPNIEMYACELLSVPGAQVKDIAGLVGYSNISHFSDAFRKKFGCTPSEYKRSLPF